MGPPNSFSSLTWGQIQDQLNANGGDAFSMSRDVLSGAASMSDYNNPRVKGVRKSADRTENGMNILKTPIAIITDVTGSGMTTPQIVRDDIPQLMGLLKIRQDIFPDILFMALGDIVCDSYPAQMGQFESGADEISYALSQLILEGGGGGNQYESYTEALYALGYKTNIDSVKRGVKGTAVIIGDELPRPIAKMNDLNKYWLSNEERVNRDYTLTEIMEKVRENWNIYFVICATASYWDDKTVEKKWREVVGNENFIRLIKPEDISELVASLVLVNNGVEVNTIVNQLVAIGEVSSVNDIRNALVTVANSGVNNPIVSTQHSNRLSRF